MKSASIHCDVSLLSQSGGDTKVIYFYASVLISSPWCLWMLSANLHRLSFLLCDGGKKSIGLKGTEEPARFGGCSGFSNLKDVKFMIHVYIDG